MSKFEKFIVFGPVVVIPIAGMQTEQLFEGFVAGIITCILVYLKIAVAKAARKF